MGFPPIVFNVFYVIQEKACWWSSEPL